MTSDLFFKAAILGTILGLFLNMLSGDNKREVKLDNGLECAVVNFIPNCNWDKYNHDTHWGEFPYDIDKLPEEP